MPVFNSINPPVLHTPTFEWGVVLQNRFPTVGCITKGEKNKRFCARIEFVSQPPPNISQKQIPLCCMFDTGAMQSIFTKNAAIQLFGEKVPKNLTIHGPKPDQSAAPKPETLESKKSIHNSNYVGVRVSSIVDGQHIKIPIYFFVEKQGNTYIWSDYKHNTIGMKGLIDNKMLCFTTDHLYILKIR